MIAQLRGAIVRTDGQQTILDVKGIGYAVNISGRTQGQLGTMAGEVTLLTEMQVREDSMTLFGFLDLAERDAFRLLITVQGVGAKAAMAILSVLSPSDLTNAIIAGDKAMVARADGVGPKIAQRVAISFCKTLPPTTGTDLRAKHKKSSKIITCRIYDRDTAPPGPQNCPKTRPGERSLVS